MGGKNADFLVGLREQGAVTGRLLRSGAVQCSQRVGKWESPRGERRVAGTGQQMGDCRKGLKC